MEDFIDDEGEGQDEISKHIREIFGYDRSRWVLHQFEVQALFLVLFMLQYKCVMHFCDLRYKDESDYALKFMESSWKEQQKEEARR